MPANNLPIFVLTPNTPVGQVIGATARTTSDGSGTIGTDMIKIFTAGANGSYLESVRLSPTTSVSGTKTAATTLRIYLSSATSGAVTSANTTLIREIAAPSQAAAQRTGETVYYDIEFKKKIQAGYTLLVSSHVVNVANTAWVANAWGGDY